jgi:hypothetical protein
MAQWLGAGLSLSFAAATIENFGGLKALRRSWVLSRGRKWPIQLTWIAVFLSYYLLSYISQATPQWGWLYAWRAFHPNLSRGLYTAGYYALYEAPGSLLGLSSAPFSLLLQPSSTMISGYGKRATTSSG